MRVKFFFLGLSVLYLGLADASAQRPKLPGKYPPISLGVLDGKARVLPKPNYPEKAKRAHVTGKVEVEVIVDEAGNVTSARAVSGHLLLRKASEQAALRAKFIPVRLSGFPVRYKGTIHFEFNTPDLLMEAAQDGDIAQVQALVAKGVSVNVKDAGGMTALMYAVANNRTPVMTYLLAKGADVNEKNTNGWTALMYARWDTVAETLIDKGADIETRNAEGDIPLLVHLAVAHRYSLERSAISLRVSVARKLIERGAEINVQGSSGMTPLMWAARIGEVVTVSILLQKGANLNTTNNDGRTALIEAASHNRSFTTVYLVEKGANVRIRDANGKTALDHARLNEFTTIVNILEKAR